MWQGVLCALAAMSCNSVPDIAAIQTAYEREASIGSPFHDKALQVQQAQCHGDGSDKFLCEITFISAGEPDRPYFDFVTVSRASAGWELKSGLCKP